MKFFFSKSFSTRWPTYCALNIIINNFFSAVSTLSLTRFYYNVGNQHAVDRRTDGQTDRRTDRQTVRQTNRQADSQTDATTVVIDDRCSILLRTTVVTRRKYSAKSKISACDITYQTDDSRHRRPAITSVRVHALCAHVLKLVIWYKSRFSENPNNSDFRISKSEYSRITLRNLVF